MGFEVHKLQQETLAEYLQAVRLDFGLSLEEVESQSGVLKKYLDLLERGEYRAMPEKVYVEGILKKLSRLYRIDEKALLSQLRKEWEVSAGKQDRKGFSLKRLMKVGWLPSKWALGLGASVSIVVVGILVFQITSLAMLPDLTVESPVEGENILSGVVRVSGFATPGSEVMVNGQQVYAGEKGKFEAVVGVLSGAQTLEISATNRFGRTATQARSFLVSDSIGTSTAGPVPPSVILGVKAAQGVVASVVVSGVQRPVAQSDEDFYFFGSQSTILLSTSDAGKTQVVLNGKKLGSLGRDGEELLNLPFTPGSALGDKVSKK